MAAFFVWQGCLIERQGGGWNLAAPQACTVQIETPARVRIGHGPLLGECQAGLLLGNTKFP